MQSVTLMYQSLDSVPNNAVPYLLTDRDSDSVPVTAILHDIHDQIFVGIGSSKPVTCSEILILLNRFHDSPFDRIKKCSV